jgi:uncharacterized membrane protein
MRTIALAGRVDVHPVLIVLPLVFFALSLVFDVVVMLSGATVWGVAAGVNLSAGLATASIALTSFAWAHKTLRPGTRVQQKSAFHLALAASSLVPFALSLALRAARTQGPPPSVAVALSILALGTATAAGFLGDELTRHRD